MVVASKSKYDMRYRELLSEGRDAHLFHGYGEPIHASMALTSGKMAATSTQRFWADGRRRTEDEPEYQESYWMKGVSFTRNIEYAMAWGWVVFEINQAKLVQRTKVIPYSWSFHMKDSSDFRKEQEEFAIVKATPDDYKFPSGHELEGEFDSNRFRSKSDPEGYIDLNPILEGIYLHANLGSEMAPHEQIFDREAGEMINPAGFRKKPYYQNTAMSKAGHSIEQIIAHPKFKGYYVGGKRNELSYKTWPANTSRDDLPPRDF